MVLAAYEVIAAALHRGFGQCHGLVVSQRHDVTTSQCHDVAEFHHVTVPRCDRLVVELSSHENVVIGTIGVRDKASAGV